MSLNISQKSEKSFLTNNHENEELTLLLSDYDYENQHEKDAINEWKQQLKTNRQFIQNFLGIDIEYIYQLTGGYGRYQKRLVWLLCLNCFFIAMFDPAIAFQYYLPKYYCLKNNTYVECNQTQACRQPDKMKFDYQGRTSIASQFHLECSHNTQYYLSLLFILTGFGNFIVEFITDLLGRKQLLIINNSMVIFGCLLGLFSKNIFWITIGNSILVISCSLYFTLSLVIISESIPEEQRKLFVLYVPLLYQLGGIFLYFISIYMLNYRTLYFIQLSIFWMFLLSSFYVFETLYYLQSEFNIKQMYLVTLKLNQINTKYTHNLIQVLFQINLNQKYIQKNLKRFQLQYKVQNQNRLFDLIDFYFIKSVFCLTFLAIYAEGVEKFTVVIIQSFGFKTIQMNGIVMGLLQCLSFGVVAQKIQNLPRKFLFTISLYISLFLSLLVFLINYYYIQELYYLKIALGFLISTSATISNNLIWTYAIEIFESKNRMFGISFVTLLVFFCLPFLFYIKQILEEYEYHPILVTVPCALLARFFLFFLKETIEEGINQLKSTMLKNLNIYHCYLSKNSQNELFFYIYTMIFSQCFEKYYIKFINKIYNACFLSFFIFVDIFCYIFLFFIFLLQINFLNYIFLFFD